MSLNMEGTKFEWWHCRVRHATTFTYFEVLGIPLSMTILYPITVLLCWKSLSILYREDII